MFQFCQRKALPLIFVFLILLLTRNYLFETHIPHYFILHFMATFAHFQSSAHLHLFISSGFFFRVLIHLWNTFLLFVVQIFIQFIIYHHHTFHRSHQFEDQIPMIIGRGSNATPNMEHIDAFRSKLEQQIINVSTVRKD